MDNTRDLSKFGFRELGLAGKFLSAMFEGSSHYQDMESFEAFNSDSEAWLEFNPSSGIVFYTNEDGQVLMLNDAGKVEEFKYCGECGREGFLSDEEFRKDYEEHAGI